jgi:hypothetical protein
MAQANRRAEGWAGTAQDVASDTAQKVSQDAAYVQDKLGAADETVREYTGKPLGEWTEKLKTLMRERPMMAAALMIVAGYMAARICTVALRPR